MYIHEAVTKAMETKKFISRSGNGLWSKIKLWPTNGDDGFVVHYALNNTPCHRWQPRAEDLVANDWVVVN